MSEHSRTRLRGLTRRTALRLGAATMLAPIAARAQEAGRTYRLGVLSYNSRSAPQLEGAIEELARAGFVEGGNLTVEPRGFSVPPERLQEGAAALVAAAPDALMTGGEPLVRALRQATTSIPIVAVGDDLVGNGLVASLAHPGSNLTGVSILATELDGKRQQVLTELIPGIRRLAALADPASATPERLQALQKAAAGQGIALSSYRVSSAAEIGPAIDQARASGAQALNVLASAVFHFNRREIIDRVAAAKLPAMFQWPEYVEEGALAGYGPRLVAIYRRHIARQVIKILRGTKPADIPAEQPTDFELGINLQTAEKLGLDVPEAFLTRADQVIR